MIINPRLRPEQEEIINTLAYIVAVALFTKEPLDTLSDYVYESLNDDEQAIYVLFSKKIQENIADLSELP